MDSRIRLRSNTSCDRRTYPRTRQWATAWSQAHETLGTMTTIIMRTTEGDMRVMLLLWDATSGNRSLKIVEIPVKTAPRTLNNPDFPEK